MAGEQLRITEGPARGKQLEVEAELVLGRAAAKDEARLGDDPETSRRHARLSRGADGDLTIEDLGSANGTFVNGKRIDGPRTLDLGDVVQMGQTVLQVTDSSGRAPERTRLRAGVSTGEAAGAAAVAGKELVITDGEGKGRRLKVGDELVIGRGVSGEGKLGDDPELSRRHARVASDAAGRLTIEDLGSANGTFVNSVRVSDAQALRVGDSVRIGRTTLELTESGAAPRGPAPRAAPPRPAPRAAPPRPAPQAPPPQAPAPPSPVPPRPAPSPTPERQKVSAELTLGSVFAGCRVEEVIGSGDMGVVYRAEELALERPVALKVIRREHSQEERFRERFRRESMVAASIDHPNVIPIFEAGEEGGVLFITMRLVEGTDLRELIAAEWRLEPARVARIVRQISGALDAAHARGLMHRDVKPANVLLARRDHAYLSDFGLAKRADEIGGLTRPGSIVARVEYVAPEQIKNERIDARVDVYALGCLLFEALTGEAPFAKLEGGQAMMAHLDAPVPSPVELRPDLPVQFDEVVRRAMAKEPDERYPSAGDLAQAALVAAGELRRARAESMVATGDAAPYAPAAGVPGRPPSEDHPAGAPTGIPEPATPPGPTAPDVPTARPRGGSVALRWGVALAFLAILAVAMVLALGALGRL